MIFHLYVLVLAATLAFCEDPLPNDFDARVKWPKCMSFPIGQQGTCSSSWAHAFAGMMSNRFCIKTDNAIALSPQDLVCQNKEGCSGKFDVEQIFAGPGVVTANCLSYQADAAHCIVNNTCEDPNVEFKRYNCSNHLVLNSAKEIKTELMANGPVVCAFKESIDYADYYDGIYYQAHNKKRNDFLTAAKLIGWGIENGIEFWIAETSSGKDFGENGYIRYKLKDTICTSAHTCTPAI